MGRACSTMGEKRNAYRILVGKPEGKRPLGIPRHRYFPVFHTLLCLCFSTTTSDHLASFKVCSLIFSYKFVILAGIVLTSVNVTSLTVSHQCLKTVLTFPHQFLVLYVQDSYPFSQTVTEYSGLENRDLRPWGFVALAT
jgi:prepilin signal peptidase PulO-like enzyme (type II secretory pathway)